MLQCILRHDTASLKSGDFLQRGYGVIFHGTSSGICNAAADTIPGELTDAVYLKMISDVSEPGGAFQLESFRAFANAPGDSKLAEAHLKTVIERLTTTHGFLLSQADQERIRTIYLTFLREGVLNSARAMPALDTPV